MTCLHCATQSAVSFFILLFVLRFQPSTTVRVDIQVQSFIEINLLQQCFDLPNPFYRKQKGSVEYIQRPSLFPIHEVWHPYTTQMLHGGGWRRRVGVESTGLWHERQQVLQPASHMLISEAFWEYTFICFLARSWRKKSIALSCLSG